MFYTKSNAVRRNAANIVGSTAMMRPMFWNIDRDPIGNFCMRLPMGPRIPGMEPIGATRLEEGAVVVTTGLCWCWCWMAQSGSGSVVEGLDGEDCDVSADSVIASVVVPKSSSSM